MRPSASLRCAELRNGIWGVLTGGCDPLRGYASPRLQNFSRYRGKILQPYQSMRDYNKHIRDRKKAEDMVPPYFTDSGN